MTKEERREFALAKHERDKNSKFFTNQVYTDADFPKVKITLTSNDTVSELKSQLNKNPQADCCILNFASFTNPGGGFINGALAQEEGLCYASNLYEALIQQPEFYEYNDRHKNGGAYENRAIFTDGVKFDGIGTAAVITCAAPNKSVGKYHPITWDNRKVFKDRIKFVLNIAESSNCPIFIAGAWGCGIFMQDPKETAQLFKECIEEMSLYSVQEIIFAIPPGINYNAFKEVL